jgi:hypothetical protein
MPRLKLLTISFLRPSFLSNVGFPLTGVPRDRCEFQVCAPTSVDPEGDLGNSSRHLLLQANIPRRGTYPFSDPCYRNPLSNHHRN